MLFITGGLLRLPPGPERLSGHGSVEEEGWSRQKYLARPSAHWCLGRLWERFQEMDSAGRRSYRMK